MSILETIERQIATGGWGDFDEASVRLAAERELAAERAEAMRQARIVGDALSTDAGRAFLAWLIGKTLHRAPGAAERAALVGGPQGVEAYAIAKARREGQNEIVFMILAAMDMWSTGGASAAATTMDE